MNFNPDVAEDCLLVDGVETITLHSTASVVVEGAKRGQLTLAEIEFRQVGLESTDLAWSMPAVNLQGVEPRRGDAIEDSTGAQWTILSAAFAPLTGVWRAVTRRHV